ncbi:MAG: potassium transporter Kup [Proteobacteria bacterium]|nr:potassium transporter Kup [Pseudomonadota bacterium]
MANNFEHVDGGAFPVAASQPAPADKRTVGVALAALGIVYGDIGTSPLYTIQACFSETTGIAPTPENVLGMLSLVLWSLLFVVTLKYVVVVMRADNSGEGGIVALMALTLRTVEGIGWGRTAIACVGIAGAALFYGDGMLTPAISVLSAIEGLEIATPLFKPYIIPLTLVVLLVLFMVQKRGTDVVGAYFGPVMCIWFAVLALLGTLEIVQHPMILAAVSPTYAIGFLGEHGWKGFAALGAVVLAVTGAEALYADMGHFGSGPIRRAWIWLVFPALILNYLGQGALVLGDPATIKNPFYLLAPQWALYPMVALSAAATIIASQAVISGAFSISRQAMQLGYCPRLEVRHTSDQEIGQIYIPQVNWALLVAVVALVLGFQSSSGLAAAYGIAVTGTFAATTALAAIVAYRRWGWNLPTTVVVFAGFLLVDGAFFGANLLKFAEGGWFPLVIGAIAFTIMQTWRRGRQLLLRRVKEGELSVETFLARVTDRSPLRVPGTAVFLTASAEGLPSALLHNLKHNKVLHERVVLLTVRSEDIPFVSDAARTMVQPLSKNFFRVIMRYGFKESPDLPRDLLRCTESGLHISMMETSFFLGRATLVPAARKEMPRWQEKLFFAMSRNAISATEFFRIPSNRVVELGAQLEV